MTPASPLNAATSNPVASEYNSREALETAIQVVKVAMESVPLELAKGVLISIHAVLTLIQVRLL